MECYNCGEELGKEDYCDNCGINVKIYKKIIMASNAHYNEGLKKAEVRDLSGAIESLKLSLRFYKLNADARNLLGLVYFEMGEVVAALTEWVISKNYQPRDNAASRYINEVQNNPSRLETINQTIKKYNQALLYCRQGSRDLAVLQLKKVLSLNPKLVSGHQLLALLYIQDGKYEQAKKCLRNAGKIDVNNTVTLRYLREANLGLKEHSPDKKSRRNDEQISYQSGNDTIIQPKYIRDTSALATIVNILIGLVIGAAITCFLIVPGVKRQVQNETKAEVTDANNIISSRNQTISSLESQIEDLTEQIAKAQESTTESESKISSYEQLLEAYQDFTDGDVETAGMVLSGVNTDDLSDSAKAVYDIVYAQVNAEYILTMYQEGYAAYSSQDYETAAASLEKVVEMDETYENGNAIYYLAQSYRKLDDWENAKLYYQKVVDLYPGSERAAVAQNYLAVETPEE